MLLAELKGDIPRAAIALATEHRRRSKIGLGRAARGEA